MSIAHLLRKAAAAEDRRRSPRKSCRLNCSIRRRRKRIPARVLDVSEGGLCLLSPIALQTRERVVIEIEVPPSGPVRVEAIAWHVRRVKSGNSRRKGYSIGMMLSKAEADFHALVEGRPSGDAASQDAKSEESPESEAPSPEWEKWSSAWDQLFEESQKLLEASEAMLSQADLRVFRVRVKATTGPRSRTLTLNAHSQEEAAESAAEELGEDWKVIEVTEA